VILVTVLWSIVLLSTLAMATSLTFRAFSGIMAVDRDRLRADGLLTAGLEVAAGLASSAGEIPLYDVESTVRLLSGAVRIRLDDEGGRIDIGRAPLPVLAALFRSIGAPEPDVIAQRIVEWRKSDATVANDAIPPAAETAPANAAKAPASDSAIASVSRLLQVPQMRPEWVAAITPLTTVFGTQTINPLTAPPAVLALLPGVDRARLAGFLDARRLSMDPKQLVSMLGAAQTYLKAQPPQAVAVHLTAALTDGYAAEAEAVIVCLRRDRQPYRVLAWNSLPPPPRP
jgi:general secretion pathway protein K